MSIILCGAYRYRAVSTFIPVRDQASSLQRSFTFQSESTSLADDGPPQQLLFSPESSLSQLSSLDNSDNDFVEATDLPLLPSLQGDFLLTIIFFIDLF